MDDNREVFSDTDSLADALAVRLAARGVAGAVALADLIQLEQHLIDELSIVRRLIDAVTRSTLS